MWVCSFLSASFDRNSDFRLRGLGLGQPSGTLLMVATSSQDLQTEAPTFHHAPRLHAVMVENAEVHNPHKKREVPAAKKAE